MAKDKPKANYLQNRELSWLGFDVRCLEQGSDKTVPLLERLKFVSIFWSNLQEFFMVRVGSLTDLSLLKGIRDNKSGMTPSEQIAAIHERCHEIYPMYEQTYQTLNKKLYKEGICQLHENDLNEEQLNYLQAYAEANILPLLAPQVVNAYHPFPHLETGALYVIARLNVLENVVKAPIKSVILGVVPLPDRCERIIKLPGEGFQFILLEHAISTLLPQVFSMYNVRQKNIICVTRNADLDFLEGVDEEVDFREHMKKILKKRSRLAAVRLESEYELSKPVAEFLLERLNLTPEQTYVNTVPMDMSFAFSLPKKVDAELAKALSYEPFTPAWPAKVSKTNVIAQVEREDIFLTYPYDSMDVFLELIRECIFDSTVTSIRITLYRLAKNSRLAELLMAAAEAGKEVEILFELRARFDEGNNITWSQRCEAAGCKVLYGFRDYKVHSKLCLITRSTPEGIKYITQIGTGNYNEGTAKLYTDYSYITSNEGIGKDATLFFRNANLENVSDEYKNLLVAPLQIKQTIMAKVDKQIALARAGEPCGVFFKTNSVTDLEVINKLVTASQAGVPITLFVRGICCVVPGVKGYTDNIRVISVVGRLLEHNRIYAFGPFEPETCEIYFSSADLMTRNMDRRVEVACPASTIELRTEIISQMKLYLSDNVKLREMNSDCTMTPLQYFRKQADGLADPIDAQAILIEMHAQAAIPQPDEVEAEDEDAAEPEIEVPAEPEVVVSPEVEAAAELASEPEPQVEVAAPQAEVKVAAQVIKPPIKQGKLSFLRTLLTKILKR